MNKYQTMSNRELEEKLKKSIIYGSNENDFIHCMINLSSRAHLKKYKNKMEPTLTINGLVLNGNVLKFPDFNKPVFRIFPDYIKLIKEGKCPTCKNNITCFKNKLSEKEYSISGLCQKCQDKIFK